MKFICVLFFILITMFNSNAQNSTYVRATIFLDDNPLSIEKLASLGLCVDHGIRRDNYSYTSDFSQSELALIDQAGLKYSIDIDDVTNYYIERNKKSKKDLDYSSLGCKRQSEKIVDPINFKLGSMGGYQTLNELLDVLDEMQTKYPNLITIKESIGKTAENRDIYLVKISDNPLQDEDESEVLYTGLHHAREPGSMSQMLYYMWYLLENYNSDNVVKHIVNTSELYFIPCVNPDGYAFNVASNPNGGGMWRKNRIPTKFGNFGVDLNRNYGYKWGYNDLGSSTNVAVDSYRGEAPFSENETQAIKRLCEKRQFKLALNYHTCGNLLIYPWGYKAVPLTPDSLLFETYAKKLTSDNHFIFGLSGKTVGYGVNGKADDWMYGEQQTKNKIISMTPEIGSFDDFFWPAINRVIPINQESLTQNIQLALFAGTYATVENRKSFIIPNEKGYLQFEVKRLGLEDNGVFTVNITPLSGIKSVGPKKTFSSLALLESRIDSIYYELNTGIPHGQSISYVLTISNGSYIINDTVHTIFAEKYVEFSDSINSLTNWNTNSFSLINHPDKLNDLVLTDSPNGLYAGNTNAYLTLKKVIDLKNVIAAELTFDVKWDIEVANDYLAVYISDDGGSNWTQPCGNLARIGTLNQSNYSIIYDGFQSNWIKEKINLSDYLGTEILVKFVFKTDDAVNRDGVLIDNIMVEVGKKSNKNELINFSILNPFSKGTITDTNCVIKVPNSTDLTKLVSEFVISPLAKAYVSNYEQTSGVTKNNFTNSVVYEIMAENGSFKKYLVTVIEDKATASLFSTAENFICIYPNPANTYFYIEKQNENSQVSISDITGKMVNQFTVKDFGSGIKQVDISLLDSAIYFVTVKTNDQIITRKIEVIK